MPFPFPRLRKLKNPSVCRSNLRTASTVPAIRSDRVKQRRRVDWPIRKLTHEPQIRSRGISGRKYVAANSRNSSNVCRCGRTIRGFRADSARRKMQKLCSEKPRNDVGSCHDGGNRAVGPRFPREMAAAQDELPRRARLYAYLSRTRVTRRVVNLFSVLIYANTCLHVARRGPHNPDCVSRA